MSDISTLEPAQVTAGDRWQWTRSLSDYDAATWTLTYALVKPDKKLTLTATADGSDHLIDVPASTTADYPAGVYSWQAYVTHADGSRYTVGAGRIEIKPNLAAQTDGYDARSFARRQLARIEAAIEAKDPSLANYSIQTANGSRSAAYRTMEDLFLAYDRFKAEVAQEDAAESIANGLGNPRKFFVRFGRA